MKYSSLVLPVLALAASITACNDESTIGSSLVQDKVEIVVDSSFTVTGQTIRNDYVQSRTTSQLLGALVADDFGRISSDFVTQFMPSSVIDTTNVSVNEIDSLKLVMSVQKGAFVGDSIVPMGLEVYRLRETLPSPIFSNFDPEGYYDPTPIASTVYNLTYQSADTIYDSRYRQISVKLPIELGRTFYSEYKKNPANFASPTAFAKIFPGLYIKNSYGSGRISTISSTLMSIYYHKTILNEKTQRDTTIYRVGNYFAVTPEIITNNNISLNVAASMKERVDRGEKILMGPTGYDIKIRFPVPEILAAFRNSGADLKVINTLTFNIPVEVIDNDDNIAVPPVMLMVLASERDKFFSENKLPDSKKSFYSSYINYTKSYYIADMREYIIEMLNKEDLTEDDYTFILTPVTATYETSSSYYDTSEILSGITPYVSTPVMGKIDLEGAKIKFTFSAHTEGGK